MRKKTLVAAAIAAALLLVAGWRQGWFADRVDPQVAELQAMISTGSPKAAQLSAEQRRAGADAFKQKVAQLNPEQRRSFFESSMPFFMSAMGRGAVDFRAKLAALPPRERNKELDKVIDAMDKWGQGGGGSGGRTPNPKDVDAFRKKMLDWTTPDQRAAMNDLAKMLRDRRAQRGLHQPEGGFF